MLQFTGLPVSPVFVQNREFFYIMGYTIFMKAGRHFNKLVARRPQWNIINEICCRKMAVDGYWFLESESCLADRGSACEIPKKE